MRVALPTWLFLSFFILENNKITAQPVNDSCAHAIEILIPDSDMPFMCISGTTLEATPEIYTNTCGISEFPTVWYKITMPGSASLINIHLTSDDFKSPVISLFYQGLDCNDLFPIGLTQSNLGCIVGYNGRAEAIGTDIGAQETYYIAITSLNSTGGDFELCVNTISVGDICVIDRNIEITSRSSGGPLTGPFFPGETVGVCLNVNSYSASGNGCQWFQGIVPIFGNGWDMSSFDANGQPLNATINGTPIGQTNNGLYLTATFDWFTDVGYHFDHPFLQIGDLDNNGEIDLCHHLYEADCPDAGGITGGCCVPCWNTSIGDILPPGWFSYGINGSCPAPGPPIAVDWGDGNSCGCCMGPWQFCFDLVVREDANCVEDSTHDLSIKFFTFSDGQVGAWTGGPSVCDLDQPAKLTLPFCCSSVETQHITIDTLCGSTTFDYILPDNGADYWQWTYVTDTITGAQEGSGGPGVAFLGNLVNPGPDVDSIVFTFLGYTGGICPEFGISATIYLYPQVHIEFDSFQFCGTPEMPYLLAPVITGGTGNLSYLWSPGGETTPSIFIDDPVDSTSYIITVTDEVGCINTSQYVLDVYSTFPVAIQFAAIENCEQEVILHGSAFGGFEPFQFRWTLPDESVVNEDFLIADQSGIYILTATDNEGCEGMDTLELTFYQGFVDLGPDTIYSDFMVTLDAGPGYLEYSWNTGEVTQFILGTPPGCYSVTVTDMNLCIASDTICVEFLTDTEAIGWGDFLNIYPNPNKGAFTFSADLETLEELTIEIFNTLGVLVYASSPEIKSGKVIQEINLEKAAPGVYTVHVSIGGRNYRGKLVVE